jgi:hypothetical protein
MVNMPTSGVINSGLKGVMWVDARLAKGIKSHVNAGRTFLSRQESTLEISCRQVLELLLELLRRDSIKMSIQAFPWPISPITSRIHPLPASPALHSA